MFPGFTFVEEKLRTRVYSSTQVVSGILEQVNFYQQKVSYHYEIPLQLLLS